MGTTFGQRLKEERLSRHLNRMELAASLSADNASESQISMLENAHREPSTECIGLLAERLQATPSRDPRWAGYSPKDEREGLRLSLLARHFWDTREYPQAALSARSAAALAAANQQPAMWWELAFLTAKSLMRCDDSAAAILELQRLLDHPLTGDCQDLSRRAHQAVAAANMARGELRSGIRNAEAAVALGPGPHPEDATAYLLALQTLVGALAETGRLDDAWACAQTLTEALTPTTPREVVGEIYWTLGNVAFMRHDIPTGLKHHGKAASLLSPTADMSRWAQFNKATAWVRLLAGVVEPATLQAIQRCELAYTVVGATEVDKLEVSLLRAHWEYLNGELTGALEILGRIIPHLDILAPQTAGNTQLLLGNALRDAGRLAEARAAYTGARDHFSQAGAMDRAAAAAGRLASLGAQ